MNDKFQIKSDWISMQEAAELCAYSQEYLSLRARQGKLFSKKIGRNWYTTKRALHDYLTQQSVMMFKPMLASAPVPEDKPKIIQEFERLNPNIFGKGTPNLSVQMPEESKGNPVTVVDRPSGLNSADQNVLSKLDKLSDSLQVFAKQVSTAIPEMGKVQQETFEIVGTYTGSWWYRMTRFNSVSKNLLKNPVRLVVVIIASLVVLFTFVGGFSFGQADAMIERIKNVFKNADTLQGHFPGTHANEVLVLDKAGNINIYGHIETQGQLRSYAPNGVAPLVIDSMTKVENLNADYLDNLSAQEFTLAYVTKNGNLTYEDVHLMGNVEAGKNLTVGQTLTVSGATHLLDSLTVDGALGVFSDAVFGKNITLSAGDLIIKKGTIKIFNTSLVKNLNAEFLDGVKKGDISLDFVTANGNTTAHNITVGGATINGSAIVNGTITVNGPGFFNKSVWSPVGSFGTLGVAGSTTIGSPSDRQKTSFEVYANKFFLDVNGNLSAGGTAGFGGNTSVGGSLTVAGFIDSNLIPSGSYDLGSSGSPWDDLFVNDITVSGSANFSGTTSKSFVLNTDNATADAEDSYIRFNRGTVTPGATLTWNSTLNRFDFDEPVNVASGSFTVAVGPVGIGTTSPVASALLDLTSTTQGFLAPRMTQAQRDAINLPAAGLLIFNSDTSTYNAYNGVTWLPVGALKTREGFTTIQANSNTLTFSPSGFIITASGSTDTLVDIDYTNGPASRSIDQTITGLWTFANDLDFSGTDHTGLRLNNITTVQRDLISALSGQTIFNTTATKMQVYNGTSWKNVGNPEIGAEVTSGTAGSVLFVDVSGNLGQDNDNFYWDVTNARLGIGTASASTKFEVQGTASASYGLFGTLQIGGFSSASFNRFGTSDTSHTNYITTTNDLLISGDLEVNASVAFDSHVAIGDATDGTDLVYINSQVRSNIIPFTNAFNLGSTTNRWGYLYADTIDITNLDASTASISGTTASDFLINSDNVSNDAEPESITFKRGSPTVNAAMQWDSTNKKFSFNFPIFIQTTDTPEPTYNFTNLTLKGAVDQNLHHLFDIQSYAGNNLFVIGPTGWVAASASFQAGGGSIATASYSRFGTGTTTKGLSSADDLLITGKTEFQDTVYFNTTAIANFYIASASYFYAQDGTAASPSFAFAIDQNTGIFRKAADSWSVSAGSLERLNLTNTTASISNAFYINSSNNIAIGTTTPATSVKLTVSGVTQFGTSTWPTNTFSQTSSKVLITDTNTPALIINNANNPATNNAAEIYLGARGTTDTADSAYVRIQGARENATSANFATYFNLKTMNSVGTEVQALRIDSSGQVAIGTTAPLAPLHVYASQASKTTLGDSRVLLLENTDRTTGDRQELGLGYKTAGTYQPVVLGHVMTSDSAFTYGDFYIATRAVTTDTAPTERFYITAAGNVGIGTTAPTTLFQVVGAASVSANFEVGGFASVGGNATIVGNLGVTGNTTLTGTLGVTGLASFTNASASSGFESSYLKTDTISNSTGTLTVNAFTLGGGITGNSQNILGLNQLTASIASISSNFEVGGYASVGGNTTIGGTLGVTGNTTLTGTLTGNSTGSNSFAGSLNLDKGLHATGNVTTAGQFLETGGASNSFAGSLNLAKGVHATGNLTTAASVFQTGAASNSFATAIGIGTTAPHALLDIRGATAPAIKVVSSDTAGGRLILSSSTSDWTTYVQNQDFRIYDGATNAGDRFTIAGGTGSVGIGSTAPVARLDIVGDSNYPNIALFRIASSSGVAQFYITKAGKVGIGTTAPSYLLDVVGDVNVPTGSHYKINGVDVDFDKWVAGTGNDIYRQNGNVGIGTTSPLTTLDVIGNASVSGNFELTGSLLATTFGRAASISGNFDPATDNTYSLGNSTYRWKDINVGPGSFNITSTTGTSGAGANYTLGQITFGSGSSLSFGTSAVGTGPVGTLALQTAGTPRLYIGGTGNVGIGTTTPANKLVVNGDISFGTNIYGRLEDSGSGNLRIRNMVNGGDFTIQTYDGSSHNVVVSSAGNFSVEGVGSSSFAGSLDVTKGIAFPSGKITASGNVGIGTTVPDSKLSVSGTGQLLHIGDSTGTSAVYGLIDNSAGGPYIGVESSVAGTTLTGTLAYASFLVTPYAKALQFGTNGAVNMTILSDGNVGIGTTAPASSLTVKKTGGAILVENASGTNVVDIGTALTLLGVGTDNDAVWYATSASTYVGSYLIPAATNTYNLGASGSNWGCLYYNNATLGTCASDERLKNNIQDLTFDNALEKISNLRLRSFEFNSAPGVVYHGLIAQETQPYAPELVTTNNDGYFNIKYGDIQWLTFEAVQELNQKVNDILTGSASYTINNIEQVNSTLTDTTALRAASASIETLRISDQLCLNGSCRTTWPSAGVASSSLSSYALLTDIPNVSGFASVASLSALNSDILALNNSLEISNWKLDILNAASASYVTTSQLTDALANLTLASGSALVDLSSYALNSDLQTASASFGLRISNNENSINSLNGQVAALASTLGGLASQSFEGLCVTGDTKLRRRRRKGKKYTYDDVAIKDIKAGDEIQALDETSGRLVWSKVNGLLDMGVKPIFTIVTETGKTIRTTGNHPYLARLSFRDSNLGLTDENQLAGEISVFGEQNEVNDYRDYLFAGHTIYQNNYDAGAFGDVVAEDVAKSSIKSNKNKALFQSKIKNSVVIGAAKSGLFNRAYFKSFLAESRNDVGVDALVGEKSVHMVGLGDAVYFKNFFLTQNAGSVAQSGLGILQSNIGILGGNFSESVTILQKLENIGNSNSRAFDARFAESDLLLDDNAFVANQRVVGDVVHGDKINYFTSDHYTLQTDELSMNGKPADWVKAGYLSAGDEIAVAGGDGNTAVFEKIASIKKTASEQVYDIEVEGTHNFIGNGIVAHNTHLSGTMTGDIMPDTDNAYSIGSPTARLANIYANNVNAGDLTWTETTSALSGATLAVGDFLGLYVSSTAGSTHTIPITLADALGNLSGNLGIGTTTANSKLEVNGSIRITSGSGGGIVFADGTTMTSAAGTLAGASSIGDVNLVADTDVNGSGAIQFVTGSSNKMTILNNGNVGIGTAVPTFTLDVAGTARVTGAFTFGSSASISTNFEVGGYASVGGNTTIGGTLAVTGATTQTGLFSFVNASGSGSFELTSATSLLGINAGAKTDTMFEVGGTASISSTLTLAGILTGTNTGSNSFAGSLDVTKGIAFPSGKITASGNVGIGTTGPSQILHVYNTAVGGRTQLRVQHAPASGTALSQIYFVNPSQTWGVGNTDTRLTFYDENNNQERMVILNTGNVGIGTTGPSVPLHVVGANSVVNVAEAAGSVMTLSSANTARGINIGPTLRFSGNTSDGQTPYAFGSIAGRKEAAGTTNDWAGYLQFNTTQTNSTIAEAMRITSTGNVGIGTTVPGAKLQVNSTSLSRVAIFKNPASDWTVESNLLLTTGDPDQGQGSIAWLNRDVGATYVSQLQFRTIASNAEPTVKMVVTGNGNVGIGTTTPTTKLQVEGAGVYLNAVQSDSIFTGAPSTSTAITGPDGYWAIRSATNESFNLDVYNSNSEITALTVLQSGNVGIGTTGPNNKLDIQGSNASAGAIYTSVGFGNIPGIHITNTSATDNNWSGISFAQTVAGANGAAVAAQYVNHDTADGQTDLIFATTAGGSDTTRERVRIDGTGDLTMSVTNSSGGNTALCWDNSGASKWGGCTSLGALKTNVEDLSLGLETVRQLRPVKFEWKSNMGVLDLGFIAEEVAAVNPLLVEYSNGPLSGVKYNTMSSLLTKAIQELDTRTSFISSATASNSLAVDAMGNIGVGTTAPAYKLHIIGDIAGTSFVNISTRTAKKDIEYVDEASKGSILDKLENLKVAKYRYNDEAETSPLRLGLIAEESPSEVLAIGGKGVDIYKLATFTLAGVQELSSKVASQSTAFEMLQARVASLSEQFSILNSQFSNTATGSAQVTVSSGGDILTTLANAVLTRVQSLWASGDIIVQGIKKTYYAIADIQIFKDLNITDWGTRSITIANTADEQTKGIFSGPTAQAADQSKVDLADNGNYLATYGVDSTRGEIQLTGSGQLVNGEARVYFDYSFSSVISPSAPLRVIITPTSVMQGQMYVVTKNQFGFVVKELNNSEDGTFDYLVIARRKGFDTDIQPSPTPTPTPDVSPTPTPSPEAPAGEATPTPSPEPEATTSPTPSPTPEISATPESTPEATPTPTPETTASPTPLPSVTPTPSPSVDPTPTPEATTSPTPESSPTP